MKNLNPKLFNKAQNDIDNCLECINNYPISKETADNVLRVATNLFTCSIVEGDHTEIHHISDGQKIVEFQTLMEDFYLAAKMLNEAVNTLDRIGRYFE